MTIAYIRTYSNKQQTESQKNAIEQFAKAKKIEIDKWLKDAKNSSKEKNRTYLQEGKRKTIPNKYKKRDFQIYLKIISIMFNKIVEFLFCADIIKTPKVFCLTFGVHYMTYFLLSNKSYPIYYLFISASIASNSGPMFRL